MSTPIFHDDGKWHCPFCGARVDVHFDCHRCRAAAINSALWAQPGKPLMSKGTKVEPMTRQINISDIIAGMQDDQR